jgi:serine/threonine protein kinase
MMVWRMVRLFSRRKTCPECARAAVPGRTTCPFCDNPYNAPRPPIDRTPSPLAPPQQPQLVAISSPSSGGSIPITVRQFTIGRTADNHLQLEGLLVSRQHALIAFENNRYVLYDRDSTNGTYVNGSRIAQHLLQSGDQIQIGPSAFLFQAPGRTAPARLPQPRRVSTPAPAPGVAPDFGRYQLTEKIGSGGAATVYKALLRGDHQIVAMKILHERDPYIRDKFEQEGEIGRRLSHPHIARIIGHGQRGETIYIVMEYVDGGSLRDKLTPGQPLSQDLVTTVVGQTAEALDYAHRQGVIHRDIKPENIMFSSSEGVKIVDFGIAKVTSSITRTTDGVIVGTPYYLSFEQAKGLPVDQRSDIYSLGVVLYEMITGQVPFAGKALEVIHKHITESPIPPSRINTSVTHEVEAVTLRALRKRPQERFQTAGEVARALGYAIQAPPPLHFEKPGVSVQSSTARAGQLAVMGGQAKGKVIDLCPAVVLLRRRDINPADMLISREHARILQQGHQSWLEGLDSTNGTFHNGRRIFDRVLLRDGDEIRLGNTVLRTQM